MTVFGNEITCREMWLSPKKQGLLCYFDGSSEDRGRGPLFRTWIIITCFYATPPTKNKTAFPRSLCVVSNGKMLGEERSGNDMGRNELLVLEYKCR